MYNYSIDIIIIRHSSHTRLAHLPCGVLGGLAVEGVEVAEVSEVGGQVKDAWQPRCVHVLPQLLPGVREEDRDH